MIKQVIITLISFLFLSLLQFAFFKGLILYCNLHIILFFAVLFAIFLSKRHKKESAVFPLFLMSGLLYDFHSQYFFGIYLIVFFLLAPIIFFLAKNIDTSRYFGVLAIVEASLLFFYVFLEMLFLVFEQKILKTAPLEVFVNLLMFFVLWSVIYVFQKKFSKIRNA